MATTQNIDFSNTQGQLTPQSEVGSGLKFDLIRDIVVILVTCKNEEDPLKNKNARVATTQNIDFSNTQGQITLQSEVGSGRNSISSQIICYGCPCYFQESKLKYFKRNGRNCNFPLFVI